jgi:hypothetical protein
LCVLDLLHAIPGFTASKNQATSGDELKLAVLNVMVTVMT